ncbi:DNA-binding anti-repressor SinI (plasmid) [Bacillus megaterium]|nr:DNA-binding anti-repressor SinI [Priestia megaterium]
MLKEEDGKLNQEWISLMKEAYQLGLSIVEVKEFIYSNQKILFLNDSGSFGSYSGSYGD